MLKVGIFAPYVKNDTTLAAVQFADWLVRCGIEVEFLSETSVASGIHQHWDRHVQRSTMRKLCRLTASATHMCWFSANSHAFHIASLATKQTKSQKTRHLFFPKWSAWTKESETFCLITDRTICLNKDTATWLDNRLDKELTNRTWANLVAPSRLHHVNHRPSRHENFRFFVVLTKSVELDLEPSFLEHFAGILQDNKYLDLTFLVDKPLRRDFRKRLIKLEKQFGSRISIYQDVPYYDYPYLAWRHDFIYLLETRYAYGALLSLLISSGVPVMCHEVSPVENYVQDQNTGLLIPCDVYDKNMPVAEVHQFTTLPVVAAMLKTNLRIHEYKQKIQQYLKRKQSSFEEFILKEFVQ